MSITHFSPLKFFSLLLCLFVFGLAAPGAFAQEQAAAQEQQDVEEGDAEDNLSDAELEQLVAPIALYPDALLSQVLMASTYPLEVVEAARWVKDNPDVKPDDVESSLDGKGWDASIISLAAIPDALAMLNHDLSWTQKLGDAFLAQQQDVLEAVQRLRLRAEEAGNLESSEQIKVEKVAASTTSTSSIPTSSGGGATTSGSSGGSNQVIVIEQANPEVVYVPAYNPTVVYGTWSYPSYPPYTWYPPGYVASSALWFGAGVVAGRALWGRCDWYRGSVNVNVNRYNRYNRTNIKNSNWKHNSRHRRGVPYKNRNTAKKHGRKHMQQARARENFRGRAQQGRQQLKANRPGQRPGAGNRPGQKPGAGNRPGQKPGAGNRPGQKPGAGNRPGQKPGAGNKRPAQRPAAKKPAAKKKVAARPKSKARPKSSSRRKSSSRSQSRKRSGGKRPSAYRGAGRGKQTRRHSSRGARSRGRSSARRGGGGRRGGGRRGGGRRR